MYNLFVSDRLRDEHQEINLVKKTVYDKANSILEIRGIEQKKSFILKNLRRYFDDVKMLSSKDPFRQVLYDLFDESSDEILEKICFNLSEI